MAHLAITNHLAVIFSIGRLACCLLRMLQRIRCDGDAPSVGKRCLLLVHGSRVFSCASQETQAKTLLLLGSKHFQYFFVTQRHPISLRPHSRAHVWALSRPHRSSSKVHLSILTPTAPTINMHARMSEGCFEFRASIPLSPLPPTPTHCYLSLLVKCVECVRFLPGLAPRQPKSSHRG